MEQQKINYDTLNVALGNEPGLLVGLRRTCDSVPEYHSFWYSALIVSVSVKPVITSAGLVTVLLIPCSSRCDKADFIRVHKYVKPTTVNNNIPIHAPQVKRDPHPWIQLVKLMLAIPFWVAIVLPRPGCRGMGS